MSAGLIPLFTSAPRVKLKLNGLDVAYAVGFNVNISVDVQPVQVIGQFGLSSLEPMMYNVVTGTIQIIRLMSQASKLAQISSANANTTGFGAALVKGVDAQGQPVTSTDASVPTGQVVAQEGLHAHLSPAQVLLSRTFDMDLYMVVPTTADTPAVAATANSAAIPAGKKLATPANAADTHNIWLRIKFCRLTSRNTNITHGQLVNEPMNFQGLFATPTSNDASASELFKLDSLVAETLG